MDQTTPRASRSARSTGPFLAVLALLFALARAGRADTMCAPTPVGVSGLPGAPDFWEQPAVAMGAHDLALPAGYGQQFDDPRWTTAWRQDLGTGGGTSTAIRALEDDTRRFLYLSFLVYAGPKPFSSADKIYIGLSDGTHGDLAQISLSGIDPLPPLRNASTAGTAVLGALNWWGTSDGGTTWTAFQNGANKECSGLSTGPGPLCWVEAGMVRAWTGSGTHAAAGSSSDTDDLGLTWVVNARIDLTKVGFQLGLGGALKRPYRIFTEMSLSVRAALPILFDWPPSSPLSFDGAGLPVSNVSNWGLASADLSACAGTAITDTSVGLTPVSAGTPKIPSTTIHVGPTNPANTFVAVLSATQGAPLPPAGFVQARFRTANCGLVGAGGTWDDILPAPFFTGTNGTPPFARDTIGWTCGGTTGIACPPFDSATQSATQCLLVEIMKATVQPAVFVQDSAWRNVVFEEPDAGAPEAGAPDAGARDAGSSDGEVSDATEGGFSPPEAGVDATVGHDAGTLADSGGVADSGRGGNADGASFVEAGPDAREGGALPVDAGHDATAGHDASTEADSAASSTEAGLLVAETGGPGAGEGGSSPFDAGSGGTVGRDASTGSDASTLPDSSVGETTDGGLLADGGSSSGTAAGCSCRTGGGRSEGSTFFMALGLVGLTRLRRRLRTRARRY